MSLIPVPVYYCDEDKDDFQEGLDIANRDNRTIMLRYVKDDKLHVIMIRPGDDLENLWKTRNLWRV